MGANESRESTRRTDDEEGPNENGGMPNNNDNGSDAANIAAAGAAAAGVALVAWGLSSMFSGNSGQSQGLVQGQSNGSSSSMGGSENGGSIAAAGRAGGGRGIFWSTPPSGYIKVNTDGSCKQEIGSIAAGGLLRDENGDWIKGFTYNIGDGTVQEAELRGILKGLSLAWESGFKKVCVESDSLTVVQYLLDSPPKVNRSLFPLITECQQLINKSWNCVVSHANREQNKAADHLASLSFKHDLGYRVLHFPPASLERILANDKAGVPAPASRALHTQK